MLPLKVPEALEHWNSRGGRRKLEFVSVGESAYSSSPPMALQKSSRSVPENEYGLNKKFNYMCVNY